MRLALEDREIFEKLTTEVRTLRKELLEARKERDELADQIEAEDQIIELKRKISDLEVQKSKIEEKNARERRDIEHKVGLEKYRQEIELDLAKREAIVEVRENNLEADRERFEQQMKFTTDRFEKEAEAVHDLMGQILKRLPTVTEHVEMSIAHNGNGKKEPADV
jgi:hypothetical protein